MAGRYDFILDAGSTFVLDFVWKTSTGFINLLDYTAHMQIREKDHNGSIVSDLTTENGGITIEPYTGRVTITIPAKDTENVKAPFCVYDVELINGDTVRRILEGRIKISPNVTR